MADKRTGQQEDEKTSCASRNIALGVGPDSDATY